MGARTYRGSAGAPAKRVAVVGAGLIGSGWAAHLLRGGLDVQAYDADPAREDYLRSTVAEVWPTLEALGLAPGASPHRLSFHVDLEAALADADFVQESAVEDIDAKVALLSQIDALTPHDVVIASSSSGFLAASLRARCRHGERVLIGHPFNPPYLIPLVEIAAGEGAAEAAVQAAKAFYAALGGRVVILQNEIEGYIANRIQSAVFKEVLYLLSRDVATLAEIDEAIVAGPAVRWASLGPSTIFRMGARTPADYPAFVDLLVSELQGGYAAPADFAISPDLAVRYVAEMERTLPADRIDRLRERRDAGVLAVRRATEPLARGEAGQADRKAPSAVDE